MVPRYLCFFIQSGCPYKSLTFIPAFGELNKGRAEQKLLAPVVATEQSVAGEGEWQPKPQWKRKLPLETRPRIGHVRECLPQTLHVSSPIPLITFTVRCPARMPLKKPLPEATCLLARDSIFYATNAKATFLSVSASVYFKERRYRTLTSTSQ